MTLVFLRPGAALLAAGLLTLAGCATAPTAAGPAARPKPGAAPTRGFGEMKPIPNPERETAPTPTPAPRAPAATPRPAARPTPAPTPVAPPVRADAGRAAALRAQGLEQLNRGSVDRAIALLQQASRLDPGNALIQRDLDRAMRIGRAVKGK